MTNKLKISAFTNEIYKMNIVEDGIIIPNSWIEAVLVEFSKPEVKEMQDCTLDTGLNTKGYCYSTFNIPVKSFFDLPGTEAVMEWTKQQIISVAPDMGFDNVSSANLTINWMNIMTKGSFVNCHTHHDDGEEDAPRKLVAILYLQAPENSAKLVVIDDVKDYTGEFRGVPPSEIPKEECFEIPVTTGDLLVHKVAVPHAVSEHLNDEPRLCLVMEFQV